MANVDPWFKCYPIEFLKGMRNLTAEEQAYYVQIVMRIYESGQPVKNDYRMIARWCQSNRRASERVIKSLIEKHRINQLDDGRLVDERAAIEVQARIRARMAKTSRPASTEFIGFSGSVSQNRSTDFIEEFRATCRNFDSSSAEPNASLPSVCPNISETSPENSLETMQILELESEMRAHTSAGSPARVRSNANTALLEAMASSCITTEEQRALILLVESAVALTSKAVILPDDWKLEYVRTKLSLVLKNHRLVVLEAGSRKATEAIERFELASGSGETVDAGF